MDLELIKKHIKEVGYTKSAQKNIRFYLLGCGELYTVDELSIVDGRGEHSFEDFYLWYNNDGELDLSERVVAIEDIQSKNLAYVPIGNLVGLLESYGITCIYPDETIEDTDKEDYITIEALSPLLGGWTNVSVCPTCVANALREMGYKIEKPQ